MDLPVSLLDGFGTVVVVLLVGWSIVGGRLVPRSTLDFTRAVYETRLASLQHECDEWRAAAQTSEAQVGALLPAVAALSEGQKTILRFIDAMPKDQP